LDLWLAILQFSITCELSQNLTNPRLTILQSAAIVVPPSQFLRPVLLVPVVAPCV
jgi:hypothetical protein